MTNCKVARKTMPFQHIVDTHFSIRKPDSRKLLQCPAGLWIVPDLGLRQLHHMSTWGLRSGSHKKGKDKLYKKKY
jgi:hypothetical protein